MLLTSITLKLSRGLMRTIKIESSMGFLSLQQPDREITRRGPALKAAFDADGNPTKPAQGLETDKGAWLAWHSTENGKACAELLPEIVSTALRQLPVPRR